MLVTWWADGWLASRKYSRDLLDAVEHPRRPHARVVEHGVGLEQLVEAVPLLGVDDVAVEPEQLMDLDDVAGVQDCPFQAHSVSSYAPAHAGVSHGGVEDGSRVPGGARARTGTRPGAGARRRGRALPLGPPRDPRVRCRRVQRRAPVHARPRDGRVGGGARDRARPVSRSGRRSPSTDRSAAARAPAARPATRTSAIGSASCPAPGGASASTGAWRRTWSSTACASSPRSATSTPCWRRRSPTPRSPRTGRSGARSTGSDLARSRS